MKRVNITGALAITLVLQAVTSSHAAAAGERFYRWIDAEGNPVNSDVPPATGVEYEVISTDSSMVRKVEADEESATADGDSDTEEKPVPEDSRRQVIEKNPEFCAQARDNLAQLDTRARIRMRDDKGEVRYLNEQERGVEREKALAAIEAYCE